MKYRLPIVIYFAAALAFIPLGCSRMLDAKPRNTELYYRGFAAATLAFSAMTTGEATIIRPTPREPETKPQASLPDEAEEIESPIESTPETSLPDPPETPAIFEPVENPEEDSVLPPVEDGAIAEEKPTEQVPSRFIPREAPSEAKRQLWYFGGKWCGICSHVKPEVERFAESRGLKLGQDVVLFDVDKHGMLNGKAPPVPVTECPLIVLVDGTGKELARNSGRLRFEMIEDLWLSGPKREHNLDGMPVDVPRFRSNAQAAGLDLDWGKLIGTAKLTTTRTEDVRIPVPDLGEIIIPKTVSVTALPWEGGTRVAVDKGTPCPYVRSKWLGDLYPVPITAIAVSQTRAIVELRGWKDVEINLGG